MNKDEFIVFAEKTGEDEHGNYFYRLLTSNSPEIVWGDNFEQTPAGMIPDLEPDPQSIVKEYILITKINLHTAAESTWFSIQDCIDGIISLIFCGEGEKIVNVPFGMEFSKFKKCVDWFGGEIKEVEYRPKKKEDGEES